MKKLVLVFTIAFYFSGATAQDKPVNFCKDGIECKDEIINAFPEYSFSYDTVFQDVRAFVYKNKEGDQVQFFYDQYGSGSAKRYQFKSIVAPYNLMYKIYSEYYGRKIDMATFKESADKWKFDGGSLSPSKYEGWDGYWMLRIF